MKTLVVEDNASFRKAFVEALRDLFIDMTLETVDNSRDALEKIRTFAPDLVFMDIRLGKENGLELATKIKQVSSQTSIIVLTDYNLPEYREAAFRNGADDFLVKGSLNPPAIKALIKSIAKNKGLILDDRPWNR